jgi:hypothetical protein
MNRRSFLAAAVAALAGSTVAKGAVLPLTLPDTPVELAKQAGMAVPPVAADPAKVFFWGTKGVHPALLDDSFLRIHDAMYEKFARAMAERIDQEFWVSATACQKTQAKLAPACKKITGFPVRKFTH